MAAASVGRGELGRGGGVAGAEVTSKRCGGSEVVAKACCALESVTPTSCHDGSAWPRTQWVRRV